MRYLPMNLRVPGVCATCRQSVTFDGKRWTDRPGSSHACPKPACGAVMPYLHEPCARTRGHRYEHRSRYALENARIMRTGRA